MAVKEQAAASSQKSGKKIARSAAKNLAQTALGTALITVCAWVTVPVFTIPFTLQTFAVAFVGALLGWKKGTAAVAVYILMGLVGIPVFAGFKSGVAALAGSTGGYIVGFVFLALLPALAKRIKISKTWKRCAFSYLSMVVGLAACYAFGTAWFVMMYGCTVGYALMMCIVPYLAADFVKLAAAAALAVRLERYIA